jgi:hypothetical protein
MRRTADHAPAVPAELPARTLHHSAPLGSAASVYRDTVAVWLRTSGAVNELESSIWIV